MSDLHFLSIAELGGAYRARSLSPVEATTELLSRIGRLDGRLRSYVTVDAEGALRAAHDSAERFARGIGRGPLDGIPIGLKDLFDTARLRTTGNSRLFADRVPARDSDVAARLRAAGAVLLGKHAMTELAAGRMSEEDVLFPHARNPWDLSRAPGSSSSGSVAAVAAGLCAGAMGSDSGGSIRGPSSLCGVVGFKPTYGRISRHGVIPLAPTLDHVGPIARTSADARVLFETARDERSTASHRTRRDIVAPGDLRGVRVWAPLATVEATADLDPDMRVAYRAALGALADLGAVIDTAGELAEIEHASVATLAIVGAEALALYGADARSRPEVFGRGFYTRLLEGALVAAEDYVAALRARVRIARDISRAMRLRDVLVLPTALRAAWRFDAEPTGSQGVFLGVFDLTGQPAITVPCGTSEGLPLGLQIVGRPYDDEFVLAVAEAFERATSWWRRHPSLGAA